MAAIVVEGLRKSYGAFEAVKGIDLRVETGEIVAVLGPNGAGKTTTVEILEGYRTRDAGEVQVLGLDPIHGGAELRRRAGIVLQECGMDDYLSVAEMLRMHAELYPHPRPVDATIDLVGLETKANSRVKSLSGGQKRRLDLALGLIGDPELLFLDEPTTGFDPSARRAAWEVVRNLCGLGKTVLLTTHYMDEAQFLANRVVVMNQGEVVAEGPPDSIGGRARADAEIRFILPAGAGPADLPVDATVEDNGGVVLSTSEPTRDLYELTRWALDRHVALEALSVTRPSLEDVYLSLTASPHDREPHDREPHEREPTP